MNLQQRIDAFSKLGDLLKKLPEDEFKLWSVNAQSLNQWFTEVNVRLALDGIISYLEKSKLEQWTKLHNLEPKEPKNIGVVMAGNIPLVGFHDYLSVLISGHNLTVKLSAKDTYLFTQVHKKLVYIEPFFANKVTVTERLKDVDAYIATGSDNSSKHFEYYFSKKPNIIRKNRTSIAVLTGDESEKELDNLTKDIFNYFGLGCRNVTFLMIPEKYEWEPFFEACEKWKDVIHHSKYMNNYEYSRSVLLVKQVPHLDNGSVLVKEDDALNSTISVLNYKKYKSIEDVSSFLEEHNKQTQCVVGKRFIPFGDAQSPEVWDYADGVDTLEFLSNL